MLKPSWFRLSLKGLGLNSLRIQLLLWIALPVAVSLLGMSIVEIQDHEQVMTHMVQQQVDLVAQSLAVVIDAHVDQRRGLLLQWASGQDGDVPSPAMAESVFAEGVVQFPLSNTGAELVWPVMPSVSTLVAEVRMSQVLSSTAVFDESTQQWTLLHAVPVASDGETSASVLVGAEPMSALAATEMVATLDAALLDGFSITMPNGELLYHQPITGHSPSDPAHAAHGAERWVTGESPIASTGWLISVRKDWRDLVPPLLNFGNTALIIVAVAVILSLLSAYFGLRNIAWPLQRLNQAVSQVGWGDFAAIQEEVGGVAEIEDLRHALARMTDQIRQYQQELQSYIGAMTLGQEEERRRLARELHDVTVQDLIALNQQMERVDRELIRDPQRAAMRMHDLRPQVTAIIDSLRRQIHALRPLYLEDLGFVPGLEMLVRQTGQPHELVTNFAVEGNVDAQPALPIQISTFRIAQEALQNVVKHAEATQVDVSLHLAHDYLILRIADNGGGFVVPDRSYRLAREGHFGLLGMKERAQLHNGTFQIESQIGEGTIVFVRLPLHKSVGTSFPSVLSST